MNENNFTLRGKTGGELLAGFAKIAIALIVIVYLGIQSLNFFEFTFPPEQQVYAYMGFGLTGGGLIAYLLILKYGPKTSLNRIIAVVMIGVCLIGELATAGFGMQVEALKSMGMAFTAEELDMMIWIVRGLGFLHALALIFAFAGEEMVGAFGKNDSSSPSSSKTDWGVTVPGLNLPDKSKVTDVSYRDEKGELHYHPVGYNSANGNGPKENFTV